MLMSDTQNHWMLFFIAPGNIFYKTKQASLIRPHTGIEYSIITLGMVIATCIMFAVPGF